MWCKYNECGRNFDIPVTSHFCRGCEKTFDFENAVCKDIYSYRLSGEAIKRGKIRLNHDFSNKRIPKRGWIRS